MRAMWAHDAVAIKVGAQLGASEVLLRRLSSCTHDDHRRGARNRDTRTARQACTRRIDLSIGGGTTSGWRELANLDGAGAHGCPPSGRTGRGGNHPGREGG